MWCWQLLHILLFLSILQGSLTLTLGDFILPSVNYAVLDFQNAPQMNVTLYLALGTACWPVGCGFSSDTKSRRGPACKFKHENLSQFSHKFAVEKV